jgi:MFS family permease
MICGQVTMVMVMGITALHMQSHAHGLPVIAVVISSHTFGMFGFSILSGRLSDRIGRLPVIAFGAGTLVVACLLAPISLAVGPIASALFLLGLGWNFCYVGGSSLLADQLSPSERAKMQGTNDLLIGLVSAAGSLGSGIIFATLGYTTMSLIGAVTALIPLGLVGWWRLDRRASATAR